MAETKNLTLGGATLVSDHNKPKFVLLQRTRDFSVAGNTTSAGDTLQMINVPANFLALGVLVEVQTKEWTTSTQIQVGDGTDPDGWLTTAQCNLNTQLSTLSITDAVTYDDTTVTTVNSVYGSQGGKFYSEADTIDVIPTDALDNAKLRVGVWGFIANPGNDLPL
jgi:hypothetical protein